MPAIPATSWTQASSSGSIPSSGMDIHNALLLEKPATASVVNTSAPSKQTVFAGLAIGLGAVTLVIILSLILLRLMKRDTKTSKVKGLKPLLLGTPAARTFDLEKGSSLTLKSSERRQSQAKADSSLPVSAATSSETPSESLDCTILTQPSPVPSIEDELFTISSEYQSWFFGDYCEVEQGLDLIPDTSVTLGDVDGGHSASLPADILPQSLECIADCSTVVHSDNAQVSSYGDSLALGPELNVLPDTLDALATTQPAEQTIKHDSRCFDLITSSDLSPCMPSKQTFSEAALTTKIHTYGPDSTPESLPVLNSEVLSAPETAVSVETGTLEDTGSKALVTHNGRLGITSSEYIDGSSFIASIPGSSPDRPAYNKDTKNHPSITGRPASVSMDLSGFIQDYADNFGENDEEKLVEREEEINIGIIARSTAQDSSTSKRTQDNAKSPVRRYSIGPPPSCPLPPLPPTKPIVPKTDVVETGPKHRTQAPAKSILKKPHSDQRTPSAVSLSGPGKKPRGRHARLPSEDLLEKLARYAKVKSKDALYKPMRVVALEAAARDLSPSDEGAPSPVEVNIRSVDAQRHPLSSISQSTSTKRTDTPSKARFTGKVLTASRADQENTVPSSDSKSSGKRRKLFGSIVYSRSRTFVP